MINLQKNVYLEKPLLKYLLYSILVTLIDIIIVWVLYKFFNVNIVIANTTGVISGFFVHYLLASESVFGFEYGIAGFIVYFGTFIFGLIIADSLIYLGKVYLFSTLPDYINFLFSKSLSILAPFFVLYYLRKFLYGILKKIKQELKLERSLK